MSDTSVVAVQFYSAVGHEANAIVVEYYADGTNVGTILSSYAANFIVGQYDRDGVPCTWMDKRTARARYAACDLHVVSRSAKRK